METSFRQEMRRAWAQLAADRKPNIAFTLGMGLSTTADRLNRDAMVFLNRIERRANGPRWASRPNDMRIWALGFHEKRQSNWHLQAIGFAAPKIAERLVLDGSRIWKDVRMAGDYWADRIEDQAAYSRYVSKETWNEQAWADVFVYAPPTWRDS